MTETKTRYFYQHHVISAVKQWFIANEDQYLHDDAVRQMPPEEVLEKYLEWEGILGYTNTILAIIYAPED